ncbi:MAG: hypothetical protein OXC59_03065, partial [Acidimicrobiaceae bacterium]|nr:hypothetical protein [Acidimicrobiaceae bacterium]
MTGMWMLVPAAATVCSAVALVVGMRTVAGASAELREALRKSSSAAVAGDELSREAARLGDHAASTRAAAVSATARLRGRWRRHKAHRRAGS